MMESLQEFERSHLIYMYTAGNVSVSLLAVV